MPPNSSAKLHFSFGPRRLASLTFLPSNSNSNSNSHGESIAADGEPTAPSLPASPIEPPIATGSDVRILLALVSSTARNHPHNNVASPCLRLGQRHDAARRDTITSTRRRLSILLLRLDSNLYAVATQLVPRHCRSLPLQHRIALTRPFLCHGETSSCNSLGPSSTQTRLSCELPNIGIACFRVQSPTAVVAPTQK